MSQEQVNHQANIIAMMERKTQDLNQMTANFQQANADREDAEKELRVQAQDNVSLRLKMRRDARTHEKELALRDERIREITGFCNEQTEEIRQLQARPVGDSAEFVKHLLLVESVNYFHNVVRSLAFAFANRNTNKTTAEIGEQVGGTVPSRLTSINRIAMRMMAVENKTATDLGLTKQVIAQFVKNNVDLFWKDYSYGASREVLCSLARVAKHNNGQSAAVRSLRNAYKDLPLIATLDRQILEDEDDYEDYFCETIKIIFNMLVKENNLQ